MKEFLSISSTLQACNKNEMIPLRKYLSRNFLSVGTSNFQNRFLFTSLSSWFQAFNWKWHQTWMNKSKTKKILFSLSRSTHWRHSIKKLFLKNLQYSQENTCGGVSFLVKLQKTLLKRDSNTGAFLWKLRNL